MACIAAMLRYSSKLRSGVSATDVLERHHGSWQARHMHSSFNLTAYSIAATMVLIPPVATAEDVELVLGQDVRVTAATRSSSVSVRSGQGYERTYGWNGCSFTSYLSPRRECWYGSLGIYGSLSGAGFLSNLLPALFTCKGIDSIVVEESQLHFAEQQEAEHWLERYSRHYDTVWSNDGLVVQWIVSPSRRQLSVDVYQLCIGNRKPSVLPGAQDDQIRVERIEDSESLRYECIPVSRAVQLHTQKLWRAHWKQADYMNSSLQPR